MTTDIPAWVHGRRRARCSVQSPCRWPQANKKLHYTRLFDLDRFFHSEHMDRTNLASGIIFSHGVYTWQTHTVCSALLCLFFLVRLLFGCSWR